MCHLPDELCSARTASWPDEMLVTWLTPGEPRRTIEQKLQATRGPKNRNSPRRCRLSPLRSLSSAHRFNSEAPRAGCRRPEASIRASFSFLHRLYHATTTSSVTVHTERNARGRHCVHAAGAVAEGRHGEIARLRGCWLSGAPVASAPVAASLQRAVSLPPYVTPVGCSGVSLDGHPRCVRYWCPR